RRGHGGIVIIAGTVQPEQRHHPVADPFAGRTAQQCAGGLGGKAGTASTSAQECLLCVHRGTETSASGNRSTGMSASVAQDLCVDCTGMSTANRRAWMHCAVPVRGAG